MSYDCENCGGKTNGESRQCPDCGLPMCEGCYTFEGEDHRCDDCALKADYGIDVDEEEDYCEVCRESKRPVTHCCPECGFPVCGVCRPQLDGQLCECGEFTWLPHTKP